MKKIIVIGRPGSGKTTLSNKLGKILNIPVFYLDRFVADSNGKRIPQNEFINKQEEIMKGEKWIIDGNWANTIINRIKHTDTVILLDFPVHQALLQYFKRLIINYHKVRPESAGDKTRFRWHAIKSVIAWPRKQVYSILNENRDDKKVYIFHNHTEVYKFIETLTKF